MTHLHKSPVLPGKPLVDILPFIWVEYTTLHWYSWGDGKDFMVNFFGGSWHWNIHDMYNEGELLTSDFEASSEVEGYPTADAAMKAFERYYERNATGDAATRGPRPLATVGVQIEDYDPR